MEGLKYVGGKRLKNKKLISVTSFLFVTTQIAALGWVTLSYMIAAYSTIMLGEPYPIESLSQTAITTILGGAALKVIQNIFEHNDGGIFGTNNDKDSADGA